MEWYEIVISMLTGLTATIPLVIELIKYVKQSIKEKNWGSLVSLVVKLVSEAESKFDNGVDRKEWVMSMIQASADTINYDVNLDLVSELIDSLCVMSNVVNVKVEENTEEVDA
jgi:hypothetical protein